MRVPLSAVFCMVCSLATLVVPGTAFAPAFGNGAAAVARRAVAAHAAAPRLPSAAAAAPRRIASPFPGDAVTAAFAAGSMRSARSPLGLRMMSASVADVEAQIKEQGDLVRAMKEAIKADESAHSKEELTAAIDKLKALKTQLEAPAAEEPAKSTVSATAPASSEPDTLADSLALAEGRYKVKTLQGADSSLVGKEVVVKGWVRTKRSQKEFSFIEVNDGSSPKGIQVVANADMATYDAVDRLGTGAAVAVRGTLVESQGAGQKFEVKASAIEVVGDCADPKYPLQKKRHSLEFLRSIAHLRPRTNTIASVARVRSALAQATHNFFQREGFFYLQSPLITASDCEGAGEMFRVTTLPSQVSKLPQTKGGEIDYSKDFFGKPAYLTVSGQLSGETYACAMGDIYTFGPTFRAENSQTTRHLAEFWMIEPEMAFADLPAVMQNAEDYVRFVVRHVLETCPEDMQFFNDFYDKTLLERLRSLVDKPFARVSYGEAVELLQKEIARDRSKWQFPDVEFGTDLATEHERWLAETHFKGAVFVYNYPRTIKSFYMRDNPDGKTVAATDLLVPGIGELVGGSQREERTAVLEAKMAEFGLNKEDYWWYLDLRRYGSVPHSGYGLGFERLVCYVTAVENIRDAIAFPRYPGSAEF